MLTSVVVDGRTLIGADLIGGQWTTTALSGWHDGASMRRDRIVRSQQDGTHASSGFRDGRAIMAAGWARFADPVSAKQAADDLRAAVGTTRSLMIVADSAGVRTATVELDGRTGVSWANECLFSWSLPLFAPDPLLYGQETFDQTSLVPMTDGAGWVWPVAFPVDWGTPPGSTPGSLALANAGTAAYWPRLRIDGPVTNPIVTFTGSGSWVQFNGFLAAGQWLDFDLRRRLVLLNGQTTVRPQVTSYGDWLSVPSGGGSVQWVADDADPAAVLSVWSYEGAWV